MKPIHSFSAPIGNHTVTIETGRLANQAGGSVTVRQGDTIVFAAATMSARPRPGIDFLPLSVDFEERLYAVGRIPGSFFRREGRPHEKMILISRLIDRPLRPLFPKQLRNDIQLILSTLSTDQEHNMDVMGIIGASAALTISDVPWDGPIGGVRVGYIGDRFVINPLIPEMEDSQLDLRLAGSADAIIMVEAGAEEVPEEMMVEALKIGHEAIQPVIELQNEMRAKIGKPKREFTPVVVPDEVKSIIGQRVRDQIAGLVAEHTEREARNEAVDVLREAVLAEHEETDLDEGDIREVINDELQAEIRRRILDEGIRPDGRGYTDIRSLSAEVGLSPRSHGSGLFERGQTQVLSIATLGTPRDEQKLDDLYPEESKRFMHHYNFPPYCTGEVWPLRGTRRREVGHGALAEAALRPMIPDEDEFPYTIRLVSEVMSSNGSSSMASICGSTLALMDAGVPIKAPVAGIAMGLVKEGDKFAVLSDILGDEDHLGDMDFKVAGTQEGISALQMDIKIQGITEEIMTLALNQAKEGRLHILGEMAKAINAPSSEMSEFAPRLLTIKIHPDKIREVIGKGGSTIQAITKETGTQIDIQDDGTIVIASVNAAAANAAKERIEQITSDVEPGRIYEGKVAKIMDFGAFVTIAPGKDGLVHVSQISNDRVEKVADVLKEGDVVKVKVLEVDKQGRIRLSMKAVTEDAGEA
jgi:polyribonucleotide nucleotidyltransferase